MKQRNTSLIPLHQKEQHHPEKLKEYYNVHFTVELEMDDPIDLVDVPNFVKHLPQPSQKTFRRRSAT